MTDRRLRRLLGAGVSATVVGATGPALCETTGAAEANRRALLVSEIIVTAERHEAALQDAPLAVNAFTADDLKAARLDGPRDLYRAVPNTNYSRSNFGGYNLSIRGVGSKFVGLSGEYGVSVHVNATPFSQARLPDAEFFDVERVELLRGPQGSLYGRNATGGAVNILTARPAEAFGGWVTGEYGDYDSVRLSGVLNLPLNEMLAVRLAGIVLIRDGFVKNAFNGHDIDDRDIEASRLTVRLRPNDALDLNVMWERFNEKDRRSRVGKPLCVADPGPATVGGIPVSPANRGFLSQGCLPGSRYAPQAFGAVNTAATLTGLYLPLVGLARGDMLEGKVQSGDLRTIESARDPAYQVRADFYQIDARLKVADRLTLSSLTGFAYDRASSFQDYLRVQSDRQFLATPLFPAGVVNDPQLGPADTLRTFDYFPTSSKEFTQEIRLHSDYGGRWDFSIGAQHREFTASSRYFVLSNGLTAFARATDVQAGFPEVFPFFIAPGFPPDGGGRNYFLNAAENRASADAIFGELYWRPAGNVRLALGLRHTWDHKESEPNPVTLLATPTLAASPPASGQRTNPVFTGGRGIAPAPLLKRDDGATTGRLNLQWEPELAFTDRTVLYATYSRGYKAGGFNTPCDLQSPGCGLAPADFGPEKVDAYELGFKNVLSGGRLVLNLAAFRYDYRGYQIATIVNKATVNRNIDARIHGAELEGVWRPNPQLRLNLGAGWLKTRIRGGSAIDTLDRTQGDPRLAIVKAQDASNCVVNRAALGRLLAIQQGAPGAPSLPGVTSNPAALLGACSGLFQALGLYDYAGMGVTTAPIAVDNSPRPNTLVQVGQGVPVSLDGNRLPNAPEWTLAFGAEYAWDMAGWRARLRGDYYRQGDSFARIFNAPSEKLRGYELVNATLALTSPDEGFEVQVFAKNLTDAAPITDIYLTDDSSGLFTNAFTVEPRTYGVAVTRRF